MPIEIRELVIRAEVTSPQNGGNADSNSGSGDDTGRENLIRDCVEQVMELIRRKEER